MTTKIPVKLVFCLLFLLNIQIATAQIITAEIGLNGLTCSQCSRSVEMQLRKLTFVANVSMDLDHTTGKIVFKDSQEIDLDALPKAVKDAGFSTRFLKITFDLSSIQPGKLCFQYDKKVFYFLDALDEKHPDVMTFQLVGRDFLPPKEFKHYRLTASGNCAGSEKYYLKAL